MLKRLLVATVMVSTSVAEAKPASPESEDPTVEIPARPARQVGLFTSAPLLATGLDLDVGGFYGYASMAVAAPFVFRNRMWAVGVGAGWSTPLAPDSHWSFDLFAMATPGLFPNSCADCSNTTQYFLSAGVGAGVHATFDNGLTIAFRLPLLGYSYWSGPQADNAPSDMVAFFYMLSAMEHPLIAIGYRW